jgi:hypothetical protein
MLRFSCGRPRQRAQGGHVSSAHSDDCHVFHDAEFIETNGGQQTCPPYACFYAEIERVTGERREAKPRGRPKSEGGLQVAVGQGTLDV